MDRSAQKLIVRRCRAQVDQLIATTSAMPEEKLRWQPLGNGRCVMDLLADCVHCHWRVEKILRQRSFDDLPAAPDWEEMDLATMQGLLKRSIEAWAEVVLAIPDEDLDTEFDAPWGKIAVGDGLFHCYWNMVYHEGQINYIQTLYGDRDMHF